MSVPPSSQRSAVSFSDGKGDAEKWKSRTSLAQIVAAYAVEESTGGLVWSTCFEDSRQKSNDHCQDKSELLGTDPVRVCAHLFALYSAAKASLRSGIASLALDGLRVFFVCDDRASSLLGLAVFRGAVHSEDAKFIVSSCLCHAYSLVKVKDSSKKTCTSQSKAPSLNRLWQEAAFSQPKSSEDPGAWVLVSRSNCFDGPIIMHNRPNWMKALLGFLRRRPAAIKPNPHQRFLFKSQSQDASLDALLRGNAGVGSVQNVNINYREFSVLVPTKSGSRREAFEWVARNTWVFFLASK